MKALVIKAFRDKHTKALREKGKVIEVSPERFEEINSADKGPFLAAVGIDYATPPATPPAVPLAPDNDPPPVAPPASDDDAPAVPPAADKPKRTGRTRSAQSG